MAVSNRTKLSFSDEDYYGVNAFILVNDKGERHAVRYVMAPENLVHLTAEEAAKTAPDFLINELPARVARGHECLGLGSWIAPDEGPGSAPSRKPKKRRPLVPGAALRAHGFQLALDEVLTLGGRVAAKDHIGAAIDKDVSGPFWRRASLLKRSTA